jgi:hypothetical protein
MSGVRRLVLQVQDAGAIDRRTYFFEAAGKVSGTRAQEHRSKKGPLEVGFSLAFWTLGEVGIWAKIAITYCHRDS